MVILTSLSGYTFGKLLGNNCGLDCSFSDFGFIEYFLLFCTFVLAYLLGRKIVKLLKNKN